MDDDAEIGFGDVTTEIAKIKNSRKVISSRNTVRTKYLYRGICEL